MMYVCTKHFGAGLNKSERFVKEDLDRNVGTVKTRQAVFADS